MEGRSVLGLIEEKLPGMSKNHKKIGAYILNHYDRAAFMTATQLGGEIGVSESTVVRFASALGLSGYPQLQKEMGLCVRNRLSGEEKEMDAYYGRSQSEILTNVLRADAERINQSMAEIDAVAFDMAVDSILKADVVYVCGLRASEPLARFLFMYLNLIRRKVVLLSTTSISETFEQMLYISEKDCFIGISFPRYSMRTLKATEFANSRKAKVITITDSVHSPMNLYSSCNLFAKSSMISMVDSMVAPLSLINALLVAMVLKQPEEVRSNLKLLEETWTDYQFYLNDEINFIDAGDLETPKEDQNEQS
ncbi:MAG: MurR/RpiR family transcriptional regulator [Lachnospiraceae bacterium]|nr:MurR/RpiR family transcriptional regulator [Lachnospiraceae bacterium]